MTTHVKIRPGGSAREHASRLAERIVETWFGHHGGNDLEIPLSVVAVLSLIDCPPEQRQMLVDDTANRGHEHFPEAMRHMWTRFVRARPDLMNPVWPLVRPWWGQDGARKVEGQALIAAKQVADTALRYDLLGLRHGHDEVDLLGEMLTQLRPKSSLQARGQFYTPPEVCTMMAALDLPEEGGRVLDPALGTGGMWRGAAMAMREAGRDPHKVAWFGNDIDHLAIACAAVNAVLWNLGPYVLLAVADALAEPDWPTRALRMREETVGIARDAAMLNLLNGLEQTFDGIGDDVDEPQPEPAEPEPVQPVEQKPGPLPPAREQPSVPEFPDYGFPDYGFHEQVNDAGSLLVVDVAPPLEAVR